MNRILRSVRLFAGLAALSALASLAGCSSGSSTPAITVSVSPASSTVTLVAGAAQNFTATVANDSTNAGVTWAISSGGGTLTNVTTTSVTYTAASPVTTSTTIIIASSKTSPNISTSIIINLTPISVGAISPATVTLGVGGAQAFTGATVTGDGTLNQGVTWSISPATGAGTINASTGAYTAPTTVINSTTQVTVTATSKTDTTKTSTATITLQPISVAAVTPATVSLAGGQTQQFGGAAVSYDGTSSGVTWSVSPSTGAGSISSSGLYTAPAVVGSTTSATITATSVKDPTKSGTTATVTLLPISVSFGSNTSATLDAGQQYSGVAATISNDSSNSGILFTVATGGGDIGTSSTTTTTISGSGPYSPIYYTPTSVPTPTTTTITASSVKDPTRTATFSVTLNPAMAFTTPSSQTATLPGAQTNTAYSYTFAVSGGTGTKSYVVVSGNSLPPGLSLSTSGVISGTVTGAVQSYNSGIRVTDQSSNPAILGGSFTINVTAAPLVFNTPTLNTGTVGTAYSQQLTATGGTGTLTYTVNTGTLTGTGLTLSSSGLLSGTPTADTSVSGTALTFKVTDSAAPTPATQTTGSANLVINPTPLVVTTTSLPSGTAGVAYSDQLTYTGGTGTVTWTQAAGTLPSPLSLSSGGLISGTVTSATTASGLAFKATDTPDQGRTAQTQTVSGLSLTIASATPPSITTTSLPNGTTNVAYSQSIATSGGTAPFTWSISSGALPAGLSINSSTGVISGTPTTTIAVTSNFTVKIVDAASQNTTQAYTVVCGPALATGVNNSLLNGTYAFLVNGMYNGNSGSNTGAVYGFAMIGSITLNGAGAVTSGSIDHYDAKASVSSTTVTGSYTVGSDNRGTLVLNTGSKSFTFAIVAGGVSSGVASKIKLQEFDDISSTVLSYLTATGTAKLQTISTSQPSGTYVFGLTGETPCSTCATGVSGHFGTVNMVGYFTASGGTVSSGTADATDYATTYTSIALGGTTTAPVSGTGRGALTLTATGSIFPAVPTHFIYYVISPTEMYVASVDPHTSTTTAYTMLSGDVQLQTISNYTSTSLSGNAIAWESDGTNGNGTSIYSQNSSTAILELQFTSGSNAISAIQDQNQGNNQTPSLDNIYATSLGITYTLTAGGRMSLNGAGSGSPVFFFAGNGSGFGLDENNGGNTGGLYTVQQQTGGPFSLATLGGFTGVIASTPPTAVGQGTTTGTISFNSGGGSGSTTQDNAQPGTLSSGNTSSLTYTLDANGSTTGRNTSSGVVIYIINATKAVAMDSTATGSPNVSIVEK
jgi:hypothetical protein